MLYVILIIRILLNSNNKNKIIFLQNDTRSAPVHFSRCLKAEGHKESSFQLWKIIFLFLYFSNRRSAQEIVPLQFLPYDTGGIEANDSK